MASGASRDLRRAAGAARAGVALLALALAGCAPKGGSGSDASLPRQSAAPTGAEAANPKLDELVNRLGDADERRRDAAEDELRGLAEAGFSTRDGLYLLKAAGRPFAQRGERRAVIVAAVATRPDAAYIPVLRTVFPSLDAAAQTEALALLGAIDDRAAASALLDLLEGAVAAGAPPEVRLRDLASKPRFAEVYFPRILKSAKGAAAYGVLSLALAYANKGTLSSAILAPATGAVVDVVRAHRTAILAAQTRPGTSWPWDDDYREARAEAGLALDVLGHFPAAEVEPVLREATELKDPRLVYFAAVSLLRLGKSVDPGAIERVAASSEMRSWLFDTLERQGKRRLFPAKWATQKALAEAALVDWLVYPTELGRAPDEIELMKVVAEDLGPPDGVLEWYLFRFRTKPPHWAAKEGWLAGVAGPFKKSESPSATAYGDTFSKFTRWDSMPPEQHVAEVRKLVADAARRRSE